jgi:hypothetical protein
MPHLVTNDDLESMRTGVRRMNAYVSGWSEMIDNIKGSAQWIPKNTYHKDDWKSFSVTNKMILENRLSEAHRLASEINLKAADMVVHIQAVLETSRAAEAFNPENPSHQKFITRRGEIQDDYRSLEVLLHEMEGLS